MKWKKRVGKNIGTIIVVIYPAFNFILITARLNLIKRTITTRGLDLFGGSFAASLLAKGWPD